MKNGSYISLHAYEADKGFGAPSGPINTWKENRPVAIALIAGLLGVATIYLFSKTEIAIGGMAPVGLIVGLALLYRAWRDWEFGIKSLLVIVIVEGAVRKWFLPSFTELVYLYKDILVIIILAAYLRKRGRKPLLINRRLKPLRIALVVFAVYSFAVVLNPGTPHMLIPLLGLKAYCLYIPLTFLIARMFSDKAKLISFLKWYSIIVLPVALIGVMQFAESSPTASLNRYAWREGVAAQPSDVASFFDSTGAHYMRVTSTFSYVTGLSAYLPIMFSLLLGLISLNSTRQMSKSLRWLFYVCIGAVVVASFMTGSRGAVLAILLVAMLFYFFSPIKHLFRRLQQVVIIGLLAYLSLTLLFPQAYDAFYTRAFSSDQEMNESWERMLTPLRPPIDEATYAGLLGYGIGRTQNAVPAMLKMLGMPEQTERFPIMPENEPGRVMLEVGVIGFLLYTLVRCLLLVTLFQACRRIRDSESKALAIAVTCVLVVQVLTGGAIVNHTQGVYQWVLAGIPLALLNAERLSLQMRTHGDLPAR